MMVGVSGSGKSEFAKNHLIKGSGWYYVSRDQVRYSIIKEEDEYFSHEEEVFEECVKKIVWGLKNADLHYIIADATHLSESSRMKLLNALVKAGINLNSIDIIPVMIKTDIIVSLKRNSQRKGREKVPDNVIRKMALSLTDPIVDKFQYTAIMYVTEDDTYYTDTPKIMYHKNDIKMKEIPIKKVLEDKYGIK